MDQVHYWKNPQPLWDKTHSNIMVDWQPIKTRQHFRSSTPEDKMESETKGDLWGFAIASMSNKMISKIQPTFKKNNAIGREKRNNQYELFISLQNVKSPRSFMYNMLQSWYSTILNSTNWKVTISNEILLKSLKVESVLTNLVHVNKKNHEMQL